MIRPQPQSQPTAPRLGHALDETLLRLAIGQAVLAPSTHNTQPWRFHVEGHALDLWADPARRLAVSDPDGRSQVISCGAALAFLLAALRRHGHAVRVDRLPDPPAPDHLARVTLAEAVVPTLEEVELAEAIGRRRTNRGPFIARTVPIVDLIALRAAAEADGVWVDAVQDRARRHLLAELTADADREQWESDAFRAELAAWLRANRHGFVDGIPGYSLGMGDFAAQVAPLVVRTFDRGDGEAARDHELAEGAPVLCVIGTVRDERLDWLRAGESLGRLLLRATVRGLSASFLNQAIEVPALRPEVARVVGIDGAPHLVVRLGYAARETRPTPRRAIEDVLF